MFKYLVSLCAGLVIIGISLWGQVYDDKDYEQEIDVVPTPIGGLKGIQDRVIYPDFAKNFWIEGDVFVEAFIDTLGRVVKTNVVKGIDLLNEAAEMALRDTKFVPAIVSDRPVNSKVVLRITFKMED